MRFRASNVITGLLVCAAAVAVALAYRNQVLASSPQAPELRRIENWPALAEGGHLRGSRDAPVTIIEFSDFQCPFCAEAHHAVRAFQDRNPDLVSLTYRHLPLEGHVHAFAAALASECAGEQGRFFPYHDALFEKQDSIGLLGWDAFARTADVPDLEDFGACVEDGRHAARVHADLRAATAAEIRSTPTFVVNGYVFRGAISEEGWQRLIDTSREDGLAVR